MAVAGGYDQEAFSVTLPPFPDGLPKEPAGLAPPDLRLLGLLNGRYVVSAFPLEMAGLVLRWQGAGALVYEIWRAAKPVAEGGKPFRIGFLSGTSFDDTSGTPGATYYYWIKSRDSWGSSKYSLPNTGYRN